jgi:hypothetical protein
LQQEILENCLNIIMISGIKFSGLFPPKHPSPVGNASGYYLTPAEALDKKLKEQAKVQNKR